MLSTEVVTSGCMNIYQYLKLNLRGGYMETMNLFALEKTLIFQDVNDPNFQHGSAADFIHTENIVLIDKKQRIRAFYDGTDEVQMQQAIQDIEILKKLDN